MRHLGRAGLLICCVASGCAISGDTAALESRLRLYEDRVATLQRELEAAQEELTVARRESTHLRERVSESGKIVLASEQAEVLFEAEGLRINSLLTGGLNENDLPGDDVLSLVLEPIDARGEPIKLPGRVTIEILEPALDGENKTIGRWEYTPAEVRDLWHNGLFVTGFKFRLAWQTIPTHETLVVHARLETADGRSFDATDTVTVDVPAEPPRLPE